MLLKPIQKWISHGPPRGRHALTYTHTHTLTHIRSMAITSELQELLIYFTCEHILEQSGGIGV